MEVKDYLWFVTVLYLVVNVHGQEEKPSFQKAVEQQGDDLKVSSMDEIITLNEREADMNTMFEGDIYKSPGFLKMLRKSNSLKRDAMTIRTWPKGIVPYRFAKSFGENNDGREVVMKAIDAFHRSTCIKFRPWSEGDTDYIAFYHGKGCHSVVGMDRSAGYQTISLEYNPTGASCLYKGVVMHELMHALGFFHEQSRQDRDKYVNILWQNINKGMDSQFRMHPEGRAKTLDKEYDKHSIMHYGNHAFSKNNKNTILSNSDPSEELGQRDQLSEIDLRQLNKLYGCLTKCQNRSNGTTIKENGSLECQN